MLKVQSVPARKTKSFCPRPRGTPNLSLFVYIICLCAHIGGFLVGYNAGSIIRAMTFIPKNFTDVNSFLQTLIICTSPTFAILGALLSAFLADKYGRKNSIIASSFLQTFGSMLTAICAEKYMIIAGRILIGIGSGIAATVVPIYVAEVAPAHVRGRLACGFFFMLAFGQTCANLIAEGFSYVSPIYVGFRFMLGFSSIPSIIQFITVFCIPESPRWLVKQNRVDDARRVVSSIYSNNMSWIDYEMNEISIACSENKITGAEEGNPSTIRRILKTPHVLKALIIGSLLQAFQQSSASTLITYFTTQLVQTSGFSDLSIWISFTISLLRVLSTLVPIMLVDRIGRRILLIVSILGVAVLLLLMSAGFYAMNSNCGNCISNEKCGFCKAAGAKKGYCLPRGTDTAVSLVGPCMNLTREIMPKYEWSLNFCASDFALIPIVLMGIYTVFYSIGMGPLPWLHNAEFFPLWARATCASFTTAINWAFNLLFSLLFLFLSQQLTKPVVFAIYSGVTFIGLFFVSVSVPETRNYSIEEIEILFMSNKDRMKKEEHMKTNFSPMTLSDPVIQY